METSSIQNVVSNTLFKDFKPADFQQKAFNSAATLPAAHDTEKKSGVPPLLGTIAGTVLAAALVNKLTGKNLNTGVLKNGKIKEKLSEIGRYFEIDSTAKALSTAGGAILGGLAGGFLGDKNKKNRKEKVKNAVFEMTNIAVPTLLVMGAQSLLNAVTKNIKTNKIVQKALPIAFGVGLGVPIASKVSGLMNKKIFKEDNTKQRKFSPKDYIVHIDDIVTALAISKIPFLEQIQFDKILALIYMHCGFEAGRADAEGHHHGHHH